jgi:hypothetical protein
MSEIQSVLFRRTPTFVTSTDKRTGEKKYKIDKSKKMFTKGEAKRWLQKSGFVDQKVDVSPNYYRFRQSLPKRGSRTRTIDMTDGVLGVVEFPNQ